MQKSSPSRARTYNPSVNSRVLSCGRVDLAGGVPAQMGASLKRLAELPGNYAVLPGHGPATTLDAERADNPYLREAMA